MWWVFLPERRRTWRVSPADVAKARQNSSASWGSKGGVPEGVGVRGEVDVVGEERAAGEVEGHLDQRLVERQGHRAEPADAGLVAQRLGQHLAEGDPDVLDRVVGVHLEVAAGRHLEVEAAVPAELADHVVEEGQAGGRPRWRRCRRCRRTTSMEVSLVARCDRRRSGRWRMVSGWWSVIAGFRSVRPGTGRSPRGGPPSPAGIRRAPATRNSLARAPSASRRWAHTSRALTVSGPEQDEVGVRGPGLHRQVGQGGGDPAALLVEQGHPGLHLVHVAEGQPAGQLLGRVEVVGQGHQLAGPHHLGRGRPGSRGAARPSTRSWRRSGPPRPARSRARRRGPGRGPRTGRTARRPRPPPPGRGPWPPPPRSARRCRPGRSGCWASTGR